MEMHGEIFDNGDRFLRCFPQQGKMGKVCQHTEVLKGLVDFFGHVGGVLEMPDQKAPCRYRSQTPS